ncbi:MAG: YraN family protein [Cytophagales bacterium]|nr:YraN family protein [Cytophagales bacterium]
MPSEKQRKGAQAEKLAWYYLKGKGYALLERNLRQGHHEIDLIVKRDKTLVFVEVKMRSKVQYGYPEEAVNQAKREALQTAAENYIIQELEEKSSAIRFDIIAIQKEPGKTRILHIEDAF